jgi:hypothetical protein
MIKLLTSIAFIGLLATARLAAHDFWLAATREANATKVSGLVGEKFPVPDSPTAVDRVDSWRVIGASGDLGLPRELFQDGKYLATRVTLPAPGVYLGMMTIVARDIEMKGAEFTEYLRDEGLDQVIAERARLGQTDLPARERYARYSKIVLAAGAGPSAHLTRPAGMAAEFVPSVNPAEVKPGGRFSVQLLVEGKPVTGVQVSAVSRGTKLDARTDANGRVDFTLPASASWLIKTVHMIRPVQPGSPAADWQSYWVTLTFEN